MNLWKDKWISGGIFILGQNTIATEGNTKVEVIAYTDCFKPVYRNHSVHDTCYINMLNSVRDGTFTRPSKSMMQYVNDCTNFVNDREGSGDSYDDLVPSDKCGCPDEVPVLDDYCVKIDDKRYFLSPFAKFKFHYHENVDASMFKVSFFADGEDRMEFG